MTYRLPLSLALALLPFALATVCAQEPTKPAPASSPEPSKVQPPKPAPNAPTQEDLIQLRSAKLALPVFQRAPWLFDYDQARAAAKDSGKPIFAYFTRSYAPCAPCTALEDTALSDAAFAAFAKDVVLLCHLTTQVDGDPHQDLLRDKGGTGFPFLAFLDEQGKVLAKPSERTVAGFRKVLDQLQRIQNLAAQAKTDPKAAAELLLAQLQLGSVPYAEAQQRKAALTEVPSELQPQLDQALLDLEFSHLMTTSRDKAAYAAATEQLVARFRSGKRPTGEIARALSTRIMAYASEHKDPDLYEQALTALEQVIGNDKRFTKTLEMLHQQLQSLKTSAKK